MWPLILRELRREARGRSTRILRVASAAVILFALFALGSDLAAQSPRGGAIHFKGLNILLLALVWLIAPVMTADCLSQEKRDGTLPLLFLTPLRPLDIVIAKSAAHFVRAFSLLLAAAPIMMVPVLMGGVHWLQILRVLLIQVGAVVMALTAGLVASAISRRWLTARLTSALISLAAGLIFFVAHKAIVVWWYWPRWKPGSPVKTSWWEELVKQVRGTLFDLSLARGIWMPHRGGQVTGTDVGLAGGFLLFAVIFAIGAIAVAVIVIRRNWRENPSDQAQERRRNFLFKPRVGLAALLATRRRLLARNPIVWLQCSSVSSRLARICWMGLATLILATGVVGRSAPIVVSAGLVLGMAIAATGSFRKELESGALELLLVTPLSPRRLLLGRWYGLLWQFLPALIVASGLLVWVTWVPDRGFSLSDALVVGVSHAFLLGSTLTVMAMVGIAMSLSGRPFAANLALSLILVAGLPLALLLNATSSPEFWPILAFFLGAQLLNVMPSWRFARRQLAERRFIREREPMENTHATA